MTTTKAELLRYIEGMAKTEDRRLVASAMEYTLESKEEGKQQACKHKYAVDLLVSIISWVKDLEERGK